MRDEKWKELKIFLIGPTPLEVAERFDLEMRCQISAKETQYPSLSGCDRRRRLNMFGLRSIHCRRNEMA
jgi:hypothetical protein